MGTANVIVIFAAEAAALFLFVISLLLYKNRSLRRSITKLQLRLEEALKLLRQGKFSAATPTSAAQPSAAELPISYSDKLDDQIELTKEHHFGLGCRQDIALDLDPDAPLPRRTAALRHAFLIAEKEACADPTSFSWDLLATRYQQLLAFNNDYATEDNGTQEEDAQQLKDEIELAKKRINNLERFKSMYFELEERWEKCKSQADEHYSELRNIADTSEHKEDLERLIENYHSSYDEIGEIIQRGSMNASSGAATSPEQHLLEIRRLREVAADQHRIISELQVKLSTAETTEERTVLVQGLQSELQKQSRFLQESETCIKLMEDELANANLEIETLRNRALLVPQLKAALKDLQNSGDTREQIVDSLKTENRRLAKKLKLTQEAPPEDNQEIRVLRKELSTLQSKYNDLEEKFLNLKLKG